MAIIQQKTINSHVMLFDKKHFPKLSPKMFTGQFWQARNAITGQAIGRGTTYFFKHNKKEYVLRHYCRGGLIGKVLDDQYLYTGLEQSRPWQEFRLLQHMQSLDLPCPTPMYSALIPFDAGYRRFEWKCNALNAPSRRAAQRLGFSYEGVFRQAMVVKGRNRDTAWFAVIDQEWPALKEAYRVWLDPTNFGPDGQQRERLGDLTGLVRVTSDPAL